MARMVVSLEVRAGLDDEPRVGDSRGQPTRPGRARARSRRRSRPGDLRTPRLVFPQGLPAGAPALRAIAGAQPELAAGVGTEWRHPLLRGRGEGRSGSRSVRPALESIRSACLLLHGGIGFRGHAVRAIRRSAGLRSQGTAREPALVRQPSVPGGDAGSPGLARGGATDRARIHGHRSDLHALRVPTVVSAARARAQHLHRGPSAGRATGVVDASEGPRRRKEETMAEFLRKDWDLDLRAELYKEELYATEAWATARDAMVRPWDSSTMQELKHLHKLKEEERPAHIGEIVREQSGPVMIGLWYGPLKIGPSSHPLTTELLHATIYLAGSVAGYFKNRFNRVRPWVVAPDLFPPIPSPGLPAYPGGHATQMYLMARTLRYLAADKTTDIMKIAENVAANRERAGLNYPSDTEAGKKLADGVFEILMSQCAEFMWMLEKAKHTECKTLQAAALRT